ncbi:kinase-like domain-containing protein [Pelagophyceae sp. CCMP2097]|nr:kinase-like domain-containing protein [Pelagophyceae sp. CCMP2097]
MASLLLVSCDAVCAYVRGLEGCGALLGHIGTEAFVVEEITGGNLNFTWRVACAANGRSVFVKQAPDFIKCLGEGHALPSKRIAVEVEALRAFRAVAPKHTPDVLAFDAARCVAVLEDLRGFSLLRDELITQPAGVSPRLAADLGVFLAAVRSATAGREAEFAGRLGGDNNAAMRAITRAFVFTKPFDEHDETNRDVAASPALGLKAAALRRDSTVLAAVAAARRAFDDDRHCLCHGDLHAGSVMTDGDRAVVIDAEFAFFGPFAFDAALLLAGYVFAYCAARAHARDAADAVRRRAAALALLAATWDAYAAGLDPAARSATLAAAAAFAGCELLRRVLGAAQVADLSSISDAVRRQAAELLAVAVGERLVLDRPAALDDWVVLLRDAADANAFSCD